MNTGGKKALAYVAVISIITSLLYIGAVYIPILDIVIFLGAYLPIIFIYSKYGASKAVLSIAIISLILFVTMGQIYALSFLFTNAIVGLTLGYYTKKKQSGFFVVCILILILLLGVGIFIRVVDSLTGVNILTQSIDSVINSVNESKEMLKGMGYVDSNALFNINTEDLKSYLELTMPGMSLILITILSYTYYTISQKSLKRFNIELKPLEAFSNWYVPSRIAYPILILLLIGNLTTSEDLVYIVYTIRIIFYSVFIVNALATISYFLKAKKFPKVLIVIILFIIFIIIPNILVFIGLFEYVFNIRSLDKKRTSIRRK